MGHNHACRVGSSFVPAGGVLLVIIQNFISAPRCSDFSARVVMASAESFTVVARRPAAGSRPGALSGPVSASSRLCFCFR